MGNTPTAQHGAQRLTAQPWPGVSGQTSTAHHITSLCTTWRAPFWHYSTLHTPHTHTPTLHTAPQRTAGAASRRLASYSYSRWALHKAHGEQRTENGGRCGLFLFSLVRLACRGSVNVGRPARLFTRFPHSCSQPIYICVHIREGACVCIYIGVCAYCLVTPCFLVSFSYFVFVFTTRTPPR